MRILGIDPGSTVTGYGMLENLGGRVRHLAHGSLRARRGLSLAARLADIHQGLQQVIEAHQPEVAVVEEIFVCASARSALVLGQARGVALAAVAGAGLTVVEYGPRQIKQAVTGSGSAAKKDVQAMVARLLELERRPAQDAADALAGALCHAQAGRLGSLAGVARRRRSRTPRYVLRTPR